MGPTGGHIYPKRGRWRDTMHRKAGTVTTEAEVGRRWSQSRNFGSCMRQELFLLQREGNMTYTWTCTWSEIISLDIIWVPRLENAFILSHWEFVTIDAGNLCALRDRLQTLIISLLLVSHQCLTLASFVTDHCWFSVPMVSCFDSCMFFAVGSASLSAFLFFCTALATWDSFTFNTKLREFYMPGKKKNIGILIEIILRL